MSTSLAGNPLDFKACDPIAPIATATAQKRDPAESCVELSMSLNVELGISQSNCLKCQIAILKTLTLPTSNYQFTTDRTIVIVGIIAIFDMATFSDCLPLFYRYCSFSICLKTLNNWLNQVYATIIHQKKVNGLRVSKILVIILPALFLYLLE